MVSNVITKHLPPSTAQLENYLLYPTCLLRFTVKSLCTDIWREDTDISWCSLQWGSKTLPGCREVGTTHQDSRSGVEIWLTLVFLYGPEILKERMLGQLWASVFPWSNASYLDHKLLTSNWNLKFPIPRFLWKPGLDPEQMPCRKLLLRTLSHAYLILK